MSYLLGIGKNVLKLVDDLKNDRIAEAHDTMIEISVAIPIFSHVTAGMLYMAGQDRLASVILNSANSNLMRLLAVQSSRSITSYLKNNHRNVEDCPEEQDDVERLAQVSLRTTDVSRQSSSFSRSTNEVQFQTSNDPIGLQHWALVFQFSDGEKNICFEADNINGRLAVFRSETTMAAFNQGVHLGCVRTSPRQLLQFAKESDRGVDGQFHFLSNNCQSWVKRFIQKYFKEQLGLELFKVSTLGIREY